MKTKQISAIGLAAILSTGLTALAIPEASAKNNCLDVGMKCSGGEGAFFE